MRRCILVLVSSAFMATVAAAIGFEQHLLVKITAWDKAVTYEVMTPDEFKALSKELAEESRLSSRAMTEAQKEWRKSEEDGKKAFPRAVGNTKQARVASTYREADKAAEKASDYMARDAEKAAADKESRTNRKKGRSKEENAREAAREAEESARLAKARALYEQALQVLLQAKADAAAEKDAPPN